MAVRRGWASAPAAFALTIALAGCDSSLPWSAPTGEATPVPSIPVPAPVPNDLSAGSTERTLTAGAVTASIDYWSTLSMDRWIGGALKPVSMSMVTTIAPEDGRKAYLQKATMIAVPGTLDEAFDPLPPQIDQTTISPGYAVLAPQSYSQTFTIGPVPAETTLVTLHFTYDFLVQTTPTSSEYAKQAATDAMTIAIAPAGAGG